MSPQDIVSPTGLPHLSGDDALGLERRILLLRGTFVRPMLTLSWN